MKRITFAITALTGAVLFTQARSPVLDKMQQDSIYREEAYELYKRGCYIKSLDRCRQITDSTKTEDDRVLMGHNYERPEKQDSSAVCHLTTFRLNPANARNIMNISENFNDPELPDSSLFYLNKYNKIRSNLLVNSQKAYTLYKLEESPSALIQYERLKGLGDNQPESNYYMGLCYARTDNLYALYASYDSLKPANEQTKGKNPYILFQYGMVACDSGFDKRGRKVPQTPG